MDNRLKKVKSSVITDVKKHGGNRTKATKELGIDKSTLWRKTKKFNIKDL